MRKSVAVRGLFVVLLISFIGLAAAQQFPSKPIRIVASSGGVEAVARVVGQGLSPILAQPVLIDPKVAMAGAQNVASAAPDGYTLLMGGPSFVTVPLMQKAPYDPLADFVPITMVSLSANILVANASVGIGSVKELIALAKAKPGELNYASAATGSGSHLSGELFNRMAGVNIARIPYNDNSQRIADLLSGRVQLDYASIASTMPHIKAGKLRALGVTSPLPLELAPGVPTIGASLPGYEFAVVTGLLAPAKTPPAIVNRLSQDTVRYLKTNDAKEKLAALGEESVGSSPQEYTAKMKFQVDTLGKVIKEAGIRID